MKWLRYFPVSFVLVLFMSGCSVANYVVPAYTTLEFKISKDVNPDMNGKASPVVVKVFELSSRTLFESQDFFALYDRPQDVLGPDLIGKNEFEFTPGTRKSYDLNLPNGIRYAGILVAYQDIENARWREVVEINTTEYRTYDVVIDELSVFVLNR
ncbi:type VI secretion system lipoprotein TssJ [Photobacterium lutimaris]|uniref:Type VI secretion system lipoprotein TssJ n=1 Tax=Photobacterium lutimaris TaxID=388278 RepID=A0A2T3IZL3_9GAMM|nr:type VI secretion system lipoprotein TssJ [Photobacterium lutimaris]PSU34127.1 type VI secretion system lipoprotein TssJ [Photobacterium lutimaris]TDR75698.1 type VI secretion system protein VasD [Photobacterium lutimaris]